MRLPKIAFVNIDGVLANDSHRVQFALDRKWYEYFKPERMEADPVWPEGYMLVERLMEEGWQIEYLTGRRDDRQVLTFDWLLDHGFPWGALHTRPFAVQTPLANLKANFIKKARESQQFRQIVLFDDDPEVVRLVREQHGNTAAVHCTWHIKQKAMVKKAVA